MDLAQAKMADPIASLQSKGHFLYTQVVQRHRLDSQCREGSDKRD